MKAPTLKPIVIAFGTGIALGAGNVSAVDLEAMASKAMDKAKTMAQGVLGGEARDSQGNKVVIDPETGFSYGGDQMGIYAGEKVGTGAKDPTVCGTFAGSTCSVTHLE